MLFIIFFLKIENNDPDEISTSKNGVPRQIFATVVGKFNNIYIL